MLASDALDSPHSTSGVEVERIGLGPAMVTVHHVCVWAPGEQEPPDYRYRLILSPCGWA